MLCLVPQHEPSSRGLSKSLVDREPHTLRLRLPGGVADQCSNARRTAIDKWARKVQGVAFRHGVGVIQIKKPGRGQKVGDADHRRTANEPARAREVLGRAGLIHYRAIDKCKTDQAIQLCPGLRKGRTASSVNVALAERATKEWDQVDFLQKTRLSGAHIGGAAKRHRRRVRYGGVGTELGDNGVVVGRRCSQTIVRQFRSPQPIADPEALEVAALERRRERELAVQ